MAIDEILSDRRKALEEQFFRKQEAELVAKLRVKQEREGAKKSLAEVSGISDQAVLDHLLNVGVDARTSAALTLVPLVEVAWADGKLEDAERKAVLQAAESCGIRTGGESHQLLESWLTHRPDQQLRTAWVEYAKAACASMNAAEKERLKSELLGRARRVAEAAGGFLGLGPKVSRAEEITLAELHKAFES
jgi:hypothetical protein